MTLFTETFGPRFHPSDSLPRQRRVCISLETPRTRCFYKEIKYIWEFPISDGTICSNRYIIRVQKWDGDGTNLRIVDRSKIVQNTSCQKLFTNNVSKFSDVKDETEVLMMSWEHQTTRDETGDLHEGKRNVEIPIFGECVGHRRGGGKRDGNKLFPPNI